jgi:4a-hydroxytetrahydrobiopterin dehydratase
MTARLTPAEISLALRDLAGWAHDEDQHRICRTFVFSNFSEAFAFMTRVAMIAETQDHHPEWTNTYNRVEIALTTHDANGLTNRDIGFARSVNALGRDA